MGQATGLGSNAGQLLQMLAPIVMSFLAQRMSSGGMDAGGLGQVLGQEQARVAADVARQALALNGMGGVTMTSPLQRYVRDTMVITQHAFMGDLSYLNAGTVFFGGKPQPGYL